MEFWFTGTFEVYIGGSKMSVSIDSGTFIKGPFSVVFSKQSLWQFWRDAKCEWGIFPENLLIYSDSQTATNIVSTSINAYKCPGHRDIVEDLFSDVPGPV